MTNFTEAHHINGKRFLLKVETSHDYEDYLRYENLRFEIWEEPEDRMPGPRNMVCENYFNDGSALFIAVYVADERGEFVEEEEFFIGFSYGFLGVDDKTIGFRDPDNLVYYSQYIGVKEEFMEYGLGVLIKEFQKRCILGIFGVRTVSCTFDPLTGVNAYRNIHLFGMEVKKYQVAHYGKFGGRLNRTDVSCDRFYVYWHLDRQIQRPEIDLKKLLESDYLVLSSKIVVFEGKSGRVALEVPGDVLIEAAGDFALIEIPFDFYTMLRETDVRDRATRDLPIVWREKSRRAFLTLFEMGYKVIDFKSYTWEGRKRDFYILKKLKKG